MDPEATNLQRRRVLPLPTNREWHSRRKAYRAPRTHWGGGRPRRPRADVPGLTEPLPGADGPTLVGWVQAQRGNGICRGVEASRGAYQVAQASRPRLG